MKILLQHARTQLYLRSLGSWTPDPLEAYDFHHSRRAADFARDHAIGGVEIAVQNTGAAVEETFVIPVQSGRARSRGVIARRADQLLPT